MLYIDDREGSKELIAPLNRQGIPLKATRLDYGDCSFLGHGPDGEVAVGIEYKTVSDLLSSWQDGRLLGHQLPGMQQSYGVVYLLIEGAVSANYDDGIHVWSKGKWQAHPTKTKYSQLVGWLHTLTTLYDVRVVISSNLLTSAVTVASIYRWWSKEWSTHGQPITVHKPIFSGLTLAVPTRIMKVASMFPGVGSEKLPLLEERFASVREMVNTPPAIWRTIPGIGPKTADKIEEFLSRKENQ